MCRFSLPFVAVVPRWTMRTTTRQLRRHLSGSKEREGRSASPSTLQHSTLILFNLLPLIMMIMMMVMAAVEVGEVSACRGRKFGAPLAVVGACRGVGARVHGVVQLRRY